MPLPVIYALGLLKKAAASVNNEYGILEKRLQEAICKAAGIWFSYKITSNNVIIYHFGQWRWIVEKSKFLKGINILVPINNKIYAFI